MLKFRHFFRLIASIHYSMDFEVHVGGKQASPHELRLAK